MSGSPEDIIAFWREAGPEKWFTRDAAFDAEIADRFSALHGAAADGGRDEWAQSPAGALALILVLDQFSRNLHRGSALAFASDPKALQIAETALARGDDHAVSKDLQVFFYMPFEHSESLADQRMAIRLTHAMQNADYLKYAHTHHDVIRRFGRFPHRNTVLGRHTTAAEKAFLEAGGFSA
ncbi:MAG: DUF924 domain-containing protein [Hyphomicrobiales bacterium]|nr:DUF924 domain-containing protein [Hyphomicrobiales bacterium]